jgi:hypothetical protein
MTGRLCRAGALDEEDTMTSRSYSVIGAVGAVLALILAIVPSYEMDFWGPSGVGPGTAEGPDQFVEHVSWFAPILLGYGDPLPLLAGILLVLATALAVARVFRPTSSRVGLVLAAVTLGVMLLDLLVFGSGLLLGSGGIRGLGILVPVGTAVTLVCAVLTNHAQNAAGATGQDDVKAEPAPARSAP